MVLLSTSIWQLESNRLPEQSTIDSAFFRQALETGQIYLQQQFHQNTDIIALIECRAHFVDDVLQQIWQQYIDKSMPISLLAVGGYGRGELHPHSDIDLLVLLDESVSQSPPSGLSDFLTQLWDVGLEIGHSVRTIQECRQQAEVDITIATNLLESRLLIGSTDLFTELEQLTVNNKTWDAKQFYQKKKQEQIQRHQKYNDTANNLEPNIKESPGGLRDLQVISWVAQQHFNVQDLLGLKQKDFIANNEYEALKKAQRFLWSVRFLLHNLVGRKEERLMIDHQRVLASQLGYEDSDNNLAVEYFMRDYYRCARSVVQMNELLLQLFEENIILANELPDISPINRRFQVHNGYLETINAGIFAFRPYAILELFLILEQHPEIKGVRADTIRQLHAHLHLIDNRFRKDIKSRSLFMEIIRQPKGISHEFRRMNELDVLGAYLPEFGKIVGQMQHDLFHAYTVDEHTLFLVSNLRRFSCIEFSKEFPLCSEVFKLLPKPELLYIAGIYHDIAKGQGGDHSLLGVVDAKDFCIRHNLSYYDRELVCFLVRYHLLMSTTAQKQDIDDPEVIKKFAEKIKSTNNLNYLYLLTVADIRATNNNLWNGWRDSLLKQLYHSTKKWLQHQDSQAQNTDQKSEEKYQQALNQLIANGYLQTDIELLWRHYNSDYFLRHAIDEIVWQSEQRLLHHYMPTLVKVRNNSEHNTLGIFIISADKSGGFATITACLEQLQLDIFDAKINTTKNGEVLNTFTVSGNTYNNEQIQERLNEALSDLSKTKAYCPVLIPRKMKLFKTTPTLKFQINEQQRHTILELYTHDRPGLVSAIAKVFLRCDVRLINAKLTTLGDQVEDVFFICNQDDAPLNAQQTGKLEIELVNALIH